MSGAKDRMRHKKMRNQPSSVTYSSPDWSGSQKRNGGDTPHSGRSFDSSSHMRGGGPSPSDRYHQQGGWMRGRQAGAQAYAQDLPKCLTASSFAKARAAEVNAMLKAVNKTTGSCHVFGALPKHMRRRAMSHNTKRLPCRLREGALKMLEKSQQSAQKGKKELSKNKSRKARRRHGNLLLEFNRRQRKNKWLETHIWHAKRFHMVKRWGYCLGDRPTQKCYRACYRAMSSHCLLQDLSYYCCIELQGPEDLLLRSLSRLTSKETGPTFAASLCLSGRREGSVMLYRPDQYPSQALGPVLFLWRPCTKGSAHRQLWIWAHPTVKQDLLPELKAVCQCSEAVVPSATAAVPVPAPVPTPVPESTQPSPTGQPTSRKRKRTDGNPDGQPAKKIVGDGTRSPTTPVSWRSPVSGIVISDLSMEIVRYRLIGPLSHTVLSETLEPATDCDAESKSKSCAFWWPEHCKNQDNMSLHQQQSDIFQLFKGVYSTAEFPAGTVLGLTVDDPRLTLPRKKDKALPNLQKAEGVDEDRLRDISLRGVPEQCSHSALWEQSVRDNVTDNKISEQELNRMKSQLLVPGSRLSPVPLQGRIPVLLVHQPGKQQGQEMASWGTGWDLLLPKGWGMAFWIPLLYRGVRTGGLQVGLKHSQNKGVAHFPHDYPDCPAGARFQQEQEMDLLEKFKRRPPSKRANYIKHGCLAPFRCPWQQLVEEWEEIVREGGDAGKSPEDTVTGQPTQLTEMLSHPANSSAPRGSFAVLRNRKALKQLSAWCRPTSSKGQRAQRGSQTAALCPASVASLQTAHPSCLVWVRLSLLTKGHPVLHAMVCVPTADDLQQLLKDPHGSGPQEPQHKDHFKSRIKRRKKGHKTPSSAPKNESSDPNKEQGSDSTQSLPMDQGSSPTRCLSPEPSSTPILTVSKEPGIDPTNSASSGENLTIGLWPKPLPSVTSHCSRLTLGWITQGDFSLTAGCGEALGLVSLAGLLQMLLKQPAEQRGLVLLRNPASLQYRFAKINIEA
ncbi:ribonucleases P/MRP protein subunit POP1 [Chanos chanos]|uniref:Ribonucleases P/MRP protein subunit POP1 n=1 Tax=Chanos chanos TaxID=29144 RepID=A0A6J2W0X1_CHACN|nr:ribonucleases P/MRP protein subunit POP1 [Chanos chanos]